MVLHRNKNANSKQVGESHVRHEAFHIVLISCVSNLTLRTERLNAMFL